MATGEEPGRTYPQPIPQVSHRGAPTPNAGSAVSPPSRRELASWWKKFRKTTEKDEEKVITAPGIFGVPLAESIRYANVAISLTNEQGESFIYGYVPIVVAKCGVFLKEKATDVEGIFRLSGSAKRIKDLQTIFNSPDRYGKGLDWIGYTVHDAANILRRYLNQLPEPIVPLEQYERFRDPLRALQQRLEKHPEGQAPPEISATEHTNAVAAYQKLITELPALNRQLLLYILDLLAVFSSKSDLNRMTAANLAAIFQPGIISHPDHDMAPQEYRLSQDVLIFLIENQDNFLIGMTGTAVDEKTQKDVESGAPSLKSPKTNIGRSASNASAGADSLRKYGVRRNVSVSSHASRERTSPNVSSPGTPPPPPYPAGTVGVGVGVARSNTVPSKRSPAVGQHRFQRIGPDSPSAGSPILRSPRGSGPVAVTPEKQSNAIDFATPAHENDIQQPSHRAQEVSTVPFPEIPAIGQTIDSRQSAQNAHAPTLQIPTPQSTSAKQGRERKISNLFSKSPIFGPSDPQSISQRQPKKLQKRQRLPGATIESAQSSAASLQGEDPFHTPLLSPDLSNQQTDPMMAANLTTPTATSAPSLDTQNASSPAQTYPHAHDVQGRGSIQKSPATSLRSGTSMTDPSDFDALEDPVVKAEAIAKRNRWRFSSSAKQSDVGPLAPPPPIGQIPGARTSNSSIGSSGRARQSFTAESHLAQPTMTDSSSTGQPSYMGLSGSEYNEQTRESPPEEQKKGLFGKWKAKMVQSREERREREAEKERAKSPQRMTGDNVSSRQSLTAFAQDHLAPRGRSIDKPREGSLQVVNERPAVEAQSANISTITAGATPKSSQIGTPQTSSSFAAVNTMSTPVQNAVPVMTHTAEAPINHTGSSVTGTSGPAAATNTMPVVREEPRLELNTQAEAPRPSSVQHTPTEVQGLPQDKQ